MSSPHHHSHHRHTRISPDIAQSQPPHLLISYTRAHPGLKKPAVFKVSSTSRQQASIPFRARNQNPHCPLVGTPSPLEDTALPAGLTSPASLPVLEA